MTKAQSALSRHAVRIEGRGNTTLLLAHGYGCDQSVWHKVRPALTQVARTVSYDITGAGASDLSHFDPRGRHSELAGYASDLIEICAELNFSDLTFIGHSVSAIIGLIAAARKPRLFRDLFLIAPSPCYMNDGDYRGGFYKDQLDGLLEVMAQNFTDWAGIVAPIIMGNPGRAELHTELSESFCRWNETMAKHFARLTFLSDSRKILDTVADHCLILQCANDVIAPDFVGQYMSEKLISSSLLLLKAEGHCPHGSHPDEVVNAILSHLRASGSLRVHAA